VDEVARTIRRELDYGIEARNAEVFRRNFAGDETVSVPKVYWRYTTARVLTMERVEGTSLRQLDLDQWSAADRVSLANRITQTWMQMVFVHGFFHADPHPANILVRDPNSISVVDAERLPRRLRALGVRFPRAKEEELADRLAVIVQRYSAISIGDIDIREVLREIFGTVYAIGVTLPARWVMLDKTVATLAGVALEISPDFDVFEIARPYALRLTADRYRPDRIAGRLRSDVSRYAEAMLDYPFQVSELLDEFKDGDVEIRIKPEGFEEAVDKLEASSNRLSLALVAAALIIGSAVIGTFARSADYVGLSLLALPGILAALAIVAWLCVGIFRSGRW